MIFCFCLILRGFQHGPSRTHIEAQPITPTARLPRDTNILVVNNNSNIFNLIHNSLGFGRCKEHQLLNKNVTDSTISIENLKCS